MNKLLSAFIILSFFACKNHSPSNSSVATDSAPVAVQEADTRADETGKTVHVQDTSRERNAVDPVRPDQQKNEQLMRLVIEFYSVASGSDYTSMNMFEDSLGAYSGRIGKNIDYLRKPWGREGEVEFCLRLNELTPAEQVDFIAYTRRILKNAKWVNINENSVCRH